VCWLWKLHEASDYRHFSPPSFECFVRSKSRRCSFAFHAETANAADITALIGPLVRLAFGQPDLRACRIVFRACFATCLSFRQGLPS
jgi:hypothetical protein